MYIDQLDQKPHSRETDARFLNAAMAEINQTREVHSRLTTGGAIIELASYRISKEHARNLCSGLNELQNQLCMESWKHSGYKSDSKFATYETFGEMWAREEKTMRNYERKHNFRPADPRAPWNRDPARLNADGTVRCLGPETPSYPGIERLRCKEQF